jgi:hypothetical protein
MGSVSENADLLQEGYNAFGRADLNDPVHLDRRGLQVVGLG